MSNKFDLNNLEVPGDNYRGAAPKQQYQQQHQQQNALAPSQNMYGIGDPQPTDVTRTWGTKQEPVGTFWNRLLWAPDSRPGESFRWMAYLRTVFLVAVMACFFSVSIARTVSQANAGSVALNGFPVATVYALFIIFSYSWRHAKAVPLHVHPAILIGEMLHMHLGLVYGISIAAALWAGAFAGGGFLRPGVLNSAALPGAAPNLAVNPTSYWGAMGIDGILTIIVVLTYLHNMPIKDRLGSTTAIEAETYKYSYGMTSTAFLTGLAAFFSVMVGYPSGVYVIGNPVLYVGSALTLGWSVPFDYAWTIPCLWSIVWAIVAWAIHLFTYNVNGITAEDFKKMEAAVLYQELKETENNESAYQQLYSKKYE